MEEENRAGEEWNQKWRLSRALGESLGVDGTGDDLPLLQETCSI